MVFHCLFCFTWTIKEGFMCVEAFKTNEYSI